MQRHIDCWRQRGLVPTHRPGASAFPSLPRGWSFPRLQHEHSRACFPLKCSESFSRRKKTPQRCKNLFQWIIIWCVWKYFKGECKAELVAGHAGRACGQNTCEQGCSSKFIMDLLLFQAAASGNGCWSWGWLRDTELFFSAAAVL